MGNCCDDELCAGCTSPDKEVFVSTFYFDNHRLKIIGCPESVGEAESLLSAVLKDRIPKVGKELSEV